MKYIIVLLNGTAPYVSYQSLNDKEIKSLNCVFGYCSWVVQPELLVSNNILIGLSYVLPNEHFDWVSEWVNYKDSYNLRIVEIERSAYYKAEDYSCQYIFEVRWNNLEPTATESCAITEDFWLISKDETKHPFDQIFAIGLTDPQTMADDYGLNWAF
ncbi:MAG: hypothetical protein I8H98_01680 [Moraxellaceae bacterium]|nr:hypothetical protein [Moraxellaceae bacterium]MBH2030642.1 hypothetical protein [Moraxellaceae bacterium]